MPRSSRLTWGLTVNPVLSGADPVVVQTAYRIDYSEDKGHTWKMLERDTLFTDFSEARDYGDDNGLGFDDERRYRIFAIGRHPYTDVGPASNAPDGETLASTAPKAPTGATASSPSLRSIQGILDGAQGQRRAAHRHVLGPMGCG